MKKILAIVILLITTQNLISQTAEELNSKTLEIMLKNGGDKLGEIVKKTVKGAGEITFVYARDPEGNLIELQNWK